MTRSITPAAEHRACRRGRPRSRAAIAPSVATIGATIDDLADLSAAYVRCRPRDVADAGEQKQAERSRARARPGRGLASGDRQRRRRRRRASPRPRTTREPSIRLERDETRVAIGPQRRRRRGRQRWRSRRSVWRGGGGFAVGQGRRGRGRVGAVVPSAFAPGARPCRAPDRPTRSNVRFAHLGQDAPHLDRRPLAVGPQARPQAERRHEVLSPSQRREDVRRQGADRCRATPKATIDPEVGLARSAQRARPRGEGRCHPSERRRAPQVAPDPQGQRRPRRRARPAGWPRTKSIGQAAAAKAAKARIAAGKAGKAKGAQTAAGKARTALSKTARAEAAARRPPQAKAAPAAPKWPLRSRLPRPLRSRLPRRRPPRRPVPRRPLPRRAGRGRPKAHRQGRAEGEEGRRRPSSRRASSPTPTRRTPRSPPGRRHVGRAVALLEAPAARLSSARPLGLGQGHDEGGLVEGLDELEPSPTSSPMSFVEVRRGSGGSIQSARGTGRMQLRAAAPARSRRRP